jgi:hypothetical protein
MKTNKEPIEENRTKCFDDSLENAFNSTQEPMEWESEFKTIFLNGNKIKDQLQGVIVVDMDLINFISLQIKQAEERERERIVRLINRITTWEKMDFEESVSFIIKIINQNNE